MVYVVGMTVTAYRISPRPLTEADLHDGHVSRVWDSTGIEDGDRAGLSACDSYGGLIGYFAGGIGLSLGRGAALEGAYLVVLEGELSNDEPFDGDDEILVHPTRIVSQEPVTERFIADLCDHLTPSGDYERCVYRADRDCLAIEERCDTCDGTGHDSEEDDGRCWECDGTGWIETRAGDR